MLVLLQQMSRRTAALEHQVLQHESKVGAAMEIGMDAILRTKETRAIAVSSQRQTSKVRVILILSFGMHTSSTLT